MEHSLYPEPAYQYLAVFTDGTKATLSGLSLQHAANRAKAIYHKEVSQVTRR